MKKKNFLIYFLVIVFVILNVNVPNAFASSDAAIDNYNSVISNYYNSIDKHDWATYKSLQTNENVDDISNFLSNSANEKDNIGVFDVNSCTVDKIKHLSENNASEYTTISDYKDKYTDVNTYLVAVKFDVKKEDKYFINGTNYRLVTLGKENNAIKIIEDADAPLELIVPKNLGFNDSDEKATLEIEKEKLKGEIVNKEGLVLESNISNQLVLSNSETLASSTKYSYPSTISIYRTASKSISKVNFTTYIKNVLPNEWPQLQAGGTSEALKAGALAVKMYAWYHVLHAKYPNSGYDLKDSAVDQIYKPGTALAADNTAISAVSGIGIVNSDGKIFETQYCAGTKGKVGEKHSGKMEQWGTVAFDKANKGNYLDMCYYYWNNSSKSSGACKTFKY